MSTEFTPIFVFILLAIFGIASAMIVMSHFLGPRRNTAVKQMPYESGMDPIGDARQRFDVRYYLIAIAFLLFDVELLYLYPWAVAHWGNSADTTVAAAPELPASTSDTSIASHGASLLTGVPGIPAEFRNLVYSEIVIFVGVLFAAYAYAWRKGVFEWR